MLDLTAVSKPCAALLEELPGPPAGKTGWPWTEPAQALPEQLPDGRPWPAITIVTPTLNQGAFIEETIRSVILQGYPRLEYIVMDGGSSDGTLAVLERYDEWISWESAPDRGQSHAINRGFQRAKGDIFNWINSDDFLLPGCLATVGAIFSLAPGANWITGARLVRHPGAPPVNEVSLWWPKRWPGYLLRIPMFPQDATFFSAETWRAAGGLDEELHYMMDVDFFYRVLRGTRLGVFTPALLTVMNSHRDQKTFRVADAGKRESDMAILLRSPVRKKDSLRPVWRIIDSRLGEYFWSVLRLVFHRRAKRTFRLADFDISTRSWKIIPFQDR